MQALRLAFMAAALGARDLLPDGPIKMTRLELIPLAGRNRVLEAQIQAHCVLRSRNLRDRIFNRQAEPPVPHRILGKAATFPAGVLEQLLLEYPKGLAREAHALALALQLRRFERYPAQGAPGAAARSPAQLRFFKLLSPGGKFGVDPLNGFRTDALKVLRRPGGQLVQIIGCEPLRRTGEWPSRLVARGIGKIPDVIDLHRSRIEPGIPFSFHF